MPEVYNFVSPITVILDNIHPAPTKTLKLLLDAILKLNGDINLMSRRFKETPLSREIEKGNMEWISYLIENGADISLLSKTKSQQLHDLLLSPKYNVHNIPLPPSSPLTRVPSPTISPPMPLAVPSPIIPTTISPTISPVVQSPVVSSPIVQSPVVQSPVVSSPVVLSPEPTHTIQTRTVQNRTRRNRSTPHNPYGSTNILPVFWLSIFNQNELFELKNVIQNIMRENNMDNIHSNICSVVKQIVPGYNIDNLNKPIKARNGAIYQKSDLDHNNCNMALCAIFLLLGILSFRLQNQEYNFIFKGGKAIQLLISKMLYSDIYSSDDIDVLIMPNYNSVYHFDKMSKLAADIGYFIQWMLNSTTETINISIKVPDPNYSNENQFVTKISYKHHDAPGFTALSDIDTKPIPDFLLHYYQDPSNYSSLTIPLNYFGLNEYAMYNTLDIDPLLDEKIYYFILYYNTLDQKRKNYTIADETLKNLSEELLEIYLDKFQRSIYALTRAIAVQQYYNNNPKKTRLTHEQEAEREKEYIRLQGDYLNRHFLIKNINPIIYRIQIIKRLMKIT